MPARPRLRVAQPGRYGYPYRYYQPLQTYAVGMYGMTLIRNSRQILVTPSQTLLNERTKLNATNTREMLRICKSDYGCSSTHWPARNAHASEHEGALKIKICETSTNV
eukprot:scaffold128173_cov15-Prasinocladus_malaysianus.AAC.1